MNDTILDKILTNPENSLLLASFGIIDGEIENLNYWKNSIDQKIASQGCKTFFEEYGHYIPTDEKLCMNDLRLIACKHSGLIYAFHFGEDSYFVKDINDEFPENNEIVQTVDGQFDTSKWGEHWISVAQINQDEEALFFLRVHQYFHDIKSEEEELPHINYHDKKFKLVFNSHSEMPNADMIVYFTQKGNIIRGHYSGDVVKEGAFLGIVDKRYVININYHHFNKQDTVKKGESSMTPSIMSNGKIQLLERWIIDEHTNTEGTAIFEEI